MARMIITKASSTTPERWLPVSPCLFLSVQPFRVEILEAEPGRPVAIALDTVRNPKYSVTGLGS